MFAPRRLLLIVVLAAGCSPLAAPTAAPTAAALETSLPTATPTATPRPTVPGGLARRPGLPPLVNGEANPCLPLCVTGATEAGPFTVGERYQTKWFFGGYMTLTPAREWRGGVGQHGRPAWDSTGDLAMFLPGEDEYGTKFAMDLYPVTAEQRVEGVPNTAAGLIGWLRDHPHYDISEEIPTAIGPLPATAIDVWNSPEAPSQYPDCEGLPCSDMFSFEQYRDNGGILGDDIYRFTFADVEFNDTRHVLIVMVEARDRAHLDSLIPATEELLATVTVPAHPPTG